jgi:hypothetical protein
LSSSHSLVEAIRDAEAGARDEPIIGT